MAVWTISAARTPALVRRAVIGAAAAALVASAGQRRGALSSGGAWAGFVSGSVVTAGGWDLAAAMLTFFLSGSALSRLKSAGKVSLDGVWEKGSRRDAAQVFANGGAASLLALVRIGRPGWAVTAASFGSLAASSADTWATEIGVLARTPPRRITDGRTVARGTSGGVTLLGLLGSFAGAALLAGVAAAAPTGGSVDRPTRFNSVVIAGLGGSFVDSLLGATVQASYFCPVCRFPTEQRVHRCGTRTRLDRGVAWMGNDLVNALATIAGAAIAVGWQAGARWTREL